jgi:hypothetical protein
MITGILLGIVGIIVLFIIVGIFAIRAFWKRVRKTVKDLSSQNVLDIVNRAKSSQFK